MNLRIKICGITEPGDMEAAANLGADAAGINFHPASPRYVDPRIAAALVRAASPLMSLVGVWVTQPLRQACAAAYQLGLRGIQWYGGNSDYSDPYPFSMISVFRIKEAGNLDDIQTYLMNCRNAGWQPGALLVDSFVEGEMGGTGKKAPWELLADFHPGVPLILAGGLTPENVSEAIRVVRPAGIDVASGVESSPGKKSHDRMKAFIENARAAAAGLD